MSSGVPGRRQVAGSRIDNAHNIDDVREYVSREGEQPMVLPPYTKGSTPLVVMQLDMLGYVQIERLNTRDLPSKNFNTPAQPRAGGISLSGSQQA